MPHRIDWRRPHSWLAPVCVAIGLIVPANATAVTSKQCNAQVNDTPSKLLPCIQTADLWAHMEQFQTIANDNPSPADGMPSRNSGEPGYKASVDYVSNVMKAAGYDVTVQPYKFTYFAYQAPPVMSEISPIAHTYTAGQDWDPAHSAGVASAPLEPAGGIILPPTPTPSSSSGCTPADFAGFTPGRIALIQRGTCHYAVKVINAQNAGASGVIIFNEGQYGRTGVVAGGLADANGQVIIPTIPVAFTSFDIGSNLFAQYQQAVQAGTALPEMQLSIKALINPNAVDYNVIADSQGGDKNHVVVVDAHLDAIDGAGMLDNASGSSAILDIAQKMKNVDPLNKLRFVWFGGEENTEFGSSYYLDSRSSNDASNIGYDLDADVMATPNYRIGILDPSCDTPSYWSISVTPTLAVSFRNRLASIERPNGRRPGISTTPRGLASAFA